jgi:hypothetical protein
MKDLVVLPGEKAMPGNEPVRTVRMTEARGNNAVSNC